MGMYIHVQQLMFTKGLANDSAETNFTTSTEENEGEV